MGETIRKLRRAERASLVLPARCRSRSGFVDLVTITDLSALGCRVCSHALIVHEGDLVVVRPEGLEGLTGVVRWSRGHEAGIEFDRALYAPVVDHLQREHAQFRLTPGGARDRTARRAA